MNSFEPNKPHNKSFKKNICDVIIFFVVVNCSCVLCVAKHLDNMSNRANGLDKMLPRRILRKIQKQMHIVSLVGFNHVLPLIYKLGLLAHGTLGGNWKEIVNKAK